MKTVLKIFGGLIGIVVLLIVALAIFVMATLKPNIPEESFLLMPREVVGDRHVLVFGATGKLGTEIIQDLVQRGDKVTAFVRSSSNRSQLEPLGVDFVVGDVMSYDTVLAAFEAGEYDAAIASIAGMSADNLDYQGNVNVFDAAMASGVDRVIMISTVGAGNSADAAPMLSKLALSKILPQKTAAEDHLRESGLDFTILRPGGLPPGIVPTERGIVSEDPSTMGFIKRPDLARLVVAVLDDDRTVGLTLAVVDPGLSRPWDGSDPE
jgi:uncharacterized protein YbjT (DUF2867 family)